MRPVKIVIPGQFWDSQIYSGKLFLFGLQGDVQTYNWDELVGDWPVEEELTLAMKCAFSQSSLLYGFESKPLVDDAEIKAAITSKFERLAEKELVLDREKLEKFSKSRQDSPFPFPHSDVCIYGKKMFSTSQQGLFQARCDGKSSYAINTKVIKGWDAPLLSISANYGSLALAAGIDGLYELTLDDNLSFEYEAEPNRLSPGNFSGCNWLYFSIYGSSHSTGGKLIDFEKEDPDDVVDRPRFGREERFKRKLKGVKTEKKIFKDEGYSWGNQEKLYLATDQEIKVVKYNPWSKNDRLISLGSISIASWKGGPVSASTAHFGSVIEYDNALVILPTEGAPITLPGEPVNWRVFPRSRHYENHLHVIYEDRVEVLSFNHDYFVDQESKVMGIKRSAQGFARRR